MPSTILMPPNGLTIAPSMPTHPTRSTSIVGSFFQTHIFEACSEISTLGVPMASTHSTSAVKPSTIHPTSNVFTTSSNRTLNYSGRVRPPIFTFRSGETNNHLPVQIRPGEHCVLDLRTSTKDNASLFVWRTVAMAKTSAVA